MKILLASLAAAGLALCTSAALAQSTGSLNSDMSFTGVDTDRNGAVSWPEFSLVFDEYNEEQFNQADANGDGYLDAIEFDSLVLATGSIGMSPSPRPVVPNEEMLRSLTWSAPNS